MQDDDHDTVPHVRERLARSGVLEDEVRFGDTVARGSVRSPAQPDDVARRAPEPPPLPPALRPHHSVRIGDAEPIELDRPVRLGRAPRALRVPAAELPLLVPVASPEGGISSTHLELREQGGVVVATDLRTLNGSEVRVPGSPARSLLRGESLVVPPGTRIDLGEGVVVEVIAPRGAAAREGDRA